jgi:hypothetical protein
MTQRTIKEFIYLMKELDKLEDEIEKDNLIISFLTNKSVNEIEDMSVEEYIKLKNTFLIQLLKMIKYINLQLIQKKLVLYNTMIL